MAAKQTIAPLLLEIVLKSGRSYYIKNVSSRFDATGLFALRIWDLRGLSQSDYSNLTTMLTAKKEMDAWVDYRSIFPKLDEGILWLTVTEVEHIVEWHDRFWPEPEPKESERPVIGFRHPEFANGEKGAF
jgi:hypothetical protein